MSRIIVEFLGMSWKFPEILKKLMDISRIITTAGKRIRNIQGNLRKTKTCVTPKTYFKNYKIRRPTGVSDNGHYFPSTHQLINPQLPSTHQPINSPIKYKAIYSLHSSIANIALWLHIAL